MFRFRQLVKFLYSKRTPRFRVIVCCHISLVFVLWKTPSLICKENVFFLYFKILIYLNNTGDYCVECLSFWVWLIEFLMKGFWLCAFEKRITKMMHFQCIISGGTWGQFLFLVMLTLTTCLWWCLSSFTTLKLLVFLL